MNANQALQITECIAFLNKLKQDIVPISRSLQTVWKYIIWAIEDEKTECSLPYLPANVKAALEHSNFVISYMMDGGKAQYVISWAKKERK